MIKPNQHLLPWAVLAFGLTACNNDDVVNVIDQAEFQARTVAHDKAYIPSLFYSNYTEASEQTVADAKAALATYQPVWNDLQAYYKALSDKASSSSYLQEVSGFLGAAGNYIEDAWKDLTAEVRDKVDLSTVHEYLEDVRVSLKQWREDNNQSYLMDDMTVFHKAMEPLGARLKSIANPDQLTAEHLAALANDLSVLEPAWAKVKQVTPDILEAQYQFTREKATLVYNVIQAEGGNLTDLSLALASGDKTKALAAARKIQPTFVASFLAFGDFISPFVPDMATMEQHYIPALFLSNTKAADAATYNKLHAALSSFEGKWQRFAAHYANNKVALNWQDYFATVESSLADAKTYVDSQAANLVNGSVDLMVAHDHLENIRNTWAKLRSYENYSFVTDSLTDFHHAMEPIAIAFGSGAPIDSATVSPAVAKAQAELDKLATAINSMNASVFGFDSAKVDSIKASVKDQQTNLATLAAALSSGDTAAASSSGARVKTLFAGLFKLFGAF